MIAANRATRCDRRDLVERLRALVIDAEPIRRELASKALTAPCATVRTVGTTEAGLAELDEQVFDVVLADFDLPDMNALELIRAIRAKPHTAYIPIVVVVASEDCAILAAAYDAGATAFVTKPVKLWLLADRIRIVIRRSDSVHAAFGVLRFARAGSAHIRTVETPN